MPNDTTTTTTRPVAARDLRMGDRIQLTPDYVVTVVDDPREITTGWHAGRDQFRLATYADGADGPCTSRVNGDAIYRVIVDADPEPEPEPEPRRVHHHNMTGNIPAAHRFDALDGFRESAEPGEYVRVEWGSGWAEYSAVERIRVSITGAIYITATVRRTPALGIYAAPGERVSGWVEPGYDVSIWQEIPVSADNFDTIF